MKFIGGEQLSEAERERMIDADRQRRRIRYALRPRRDLIAIITGWRKRDGLPTPAGEDLGHMTATELAEIVVKLEDQRAQESNR